MDKLLTIVGPTSLGKTTLALQIARKFDGEIISADSRQVYKDLDIGTGKDIPQKTGYYQKGPKLGGFYLVSGVPLWGYDLVPSDGKFSVGQYAGIARRVIRDVWFRKKLPILVGGTGLYIKGVLDGIETSGIPQNRRLREALSGRNVKDLFDHLANLDTARAALLNLSDRNNPRRLIRAIEIAEWNLIKHKRIVRKAKPFSKTADVLIIGLTAPKKFIHERIRERIAKMINQGLEEEIESLLKKMSWTDQAMTSLGYRQWKDYFSGEKTKSEVIASWFRDEKDYARRQMVWFKSDKRIVWFDVTTRRYPSDVEKEINKWYR